MESSLQDNSIIRYINTEYIFTNSMYIAYYKDNNYMIYHSVYPIDWITKNEKNKTGPRWCMTCFRTTLVRGVCIGYCYLCAKKYDYKHGLGFCEIGKEYVPPEMKCLELLFSAKDTYLSSIDFSKVGIPELLHVPSIESVEFVYSLPEQSIVQPIMETKPSLQIETSNSNKNMNINAKTFTPKHNSRKK